MDMRTRTVVIAVVVAVGLATGSGTAEAAAPPDRRVPTVSVRGRARTLRLTPFTYCLGGVCVDGFLRDPKSIGRGRRVEIRTSPGATVHVTLARGRHARTGVPFGEPRCTRAFSTTLHADGAGRATLRPLGPPGPYAVGLFVNPASGGDLMVGFDWTTTRAGPTDPPHAQADVLADHDGAIDSYGVDLRVSDLATTPRDATATITVTAANGAHRTIALTRSARPCDIGAASFDAPVESGRAAAELGPAPFRYDAVVVLDGVRHEAHARWPRDVDPECEPCVPLRFSPPLPRLAI